VPLSLGKTTVGEITLRPAELKILTYLKEQPLRIISAQELVSRVLETHGCGASVRNHVLQIRKAFRAGDAPDPILTVRGVGYRFRPSTSASPGRCVAKTTAIADRDLLLPKTGRSSARRRW